MKLAKEMEVYTRELVNLESQEGKFVLIFGDKVEDVYDTYDDALREGYKRFGVDTPFLVKQIQSKEHVNFFSREITSACHI